jgi:FkbM family methyltransferase
MMEHLIAAARRAAATIEHPWDERALDWPLTKESVVVDVGGYIGRWALQIAERYGPRLYVFEPQPWAARVCEAVLGTAATVFYYGLGTEYASLSMGAWETDGCSFVKTGLGIPGTFGVLREIAADFRDLGITRIDLMMMNIEGYEYTLIPHMLDQSILPDRLMVQFHSFVDPDGGKLAAIHERMAAAGYTVPWTYGVHLTAWERQTPRKRSRKGRAA